MKSVQIVAPSHILGVWETVWPMLNIAFINYEHGDYDIEQLKVLLIKEFQLLFVVVENNKIIGCFTVEVINQMNHKVAFTTCMGGKGLFDEHTVKQYEDWCKGNGVTKIRAFAQDSQARLFKIKLGLEKVTNVVEKTL
jgi:DNA-binding LytR/AlgR family response regulator